MKGLIAKLHLREGIYYTKKARSSSGAEADRLSQTAYEKYASTLGKVRQLEWFKELVKTLRTSKA